MHTDNLPDKLATEIHMPMPEPSHCNLEEHPVAHAAAPSASPVPTYRYLVVEGGGVKGLAYVGALQALEQHHLLEHIEHVAGASAGAITALALALGYSVEDIKAMLPTELTPFKDSYHWLGWLNPLNAIHAVRTFGMHPGLVFLQWIKQHIKARLGHEHATFADLHRQAKASQATAARFRDMYVISSNLSTKLGELFCYYTTPNFPIAEAVRMSMAIPLFFEPKTYQKDAQGHFIYQQDLPVEDKYGHMYVDGGLIQNFPLNLFDREGIPNAEVLGLRVDSPAEIKALRQLQPPVGEAIKKRFRPVSSYIAYGEALLGTAMNAQTKGHIENNFRTVYIDIGDIKTTQFDVTEQEKATMIKSGYAAVNAFLASRKHKHAPYRMGQQLAADWQRLQKQDRYHIYHKADTIAYQGRFIQLVFNLKQQETVWSLQKRVGAYGERLQKSVDVLAISHGKYPLAQGGQQVMTLEVNPALLQELQKWLGKNQAQNKLTSDWIAEDRLIMLQQQRTQGFKPGWMHLHHAGPESAQQLYALAASNDIEGVKALLARKVTLDYQDEAGNNALFIAISKGHRQMVRLLLDYPLTDKTRTNHQGDTALHIAARAKEEDPHGELIGLLAMRMKEVIDSQNKAGYTPLMEAAEIDHREAVERLIAYGTNPLKQDNEGHTALDKARSKGHVAMATYLSQVAQRPQFSL